MRMRADAPRAGGTSLPAHLLRYRTGYWTDRTIGDLARARAAADPDHVVFPNDPCRPTNAGLVEDAEALAAALTDLGLRTGDVVSFQLPNWAEAAVVNLAAAIGGFVVNPIVPIYRDGEVCQMLRDCDARAVFIAGRHRSFDYGAMMKRLLPDLPGLRHVVTVRPEDDAGLPFETLMASGRGRPAPDGRVDPDSVKLLLYTSGTTGRPKGVLHSHNSLARVSLTSYAYWGLVAGDAILMPSPVSHISGYTNGLEQPFFTGTRTVLMEAWNAVEALDLIERYRIAGTVAATPFLKELADAARARGTTLPGFRIFACGGAAVPADLVRDANAAFATPCAFRVYGSSEVPLVAAGVLPTEDAELAATSDGAIPDYEVRFLDDEGRDVPPGEEGEIVARGPAMFLGYADEAQTREALTPDGYFRTGDIGRMTPQGAVLITGRKKDLIIRGGENISAKEVEDVLHRHPAIREAAVVSMPHPRLGEGVCAFLLVHDGMVVGLAELADFVAAAGLARQKCPEHVAIVRDLPRTASGKVRKDVLRGDIRAILAPVH